MEKTVSDKDLYRLCKRYGSNALQARRKFMGLLPEVFRRRLYEKKGFFSIEHFAAKLAGLSQAQVKGVLYLERRFQDKPALQQLLVSGEVSANKLIRVAAIATIENQDFLAEKVVKFSQNALETWLRDCKFSRQEKSVEYTGQTSLANGLLDNISGLLEPANADEVLRAQNNIQNINSDIELMAELSVELKDKLLEMNRKGLDINKILLELLAKRNEEIGQKKEMIALNLKKSSKKVGRYIPTAVKEVLAEEYGDKCAMDSCADLAEQIHHEELFSLVRSHDPDGLRPLCKGHHELEHADQQFYRAFKYR